MEHIDESLLNEYLDNALTSDRQQVVEAHLRVCLACQMLLDDLRAVFVALDEIPDVGMKTDLSVRVLTEIRRQEDASAVRLRVLVGVQVAATLGMLTWLWPRLQPWVQDASQRIATASGQLQLPRMLSWPQLTSALTGILDGLVPARPVFELALDQWGLLLGVALLAWLLGNRLLPSSDVNGGHHD
jgi:anti-sigma factor RsiW